MDEPAPVLSATGALGRHVAEMRNRHPEAAPELVADIVHAMLATGEGGLSMRGISLLGEIEGLGLAIAQARREIGALEVHEINGRHIPAATDQLDAIVVHTAEATNAILEICETLDEVATSLDAARAAQLQTATVGIYEACSFQDLVGQRVAKVVATLKMIDAKVAALSAALGASELPRPQTGSSADGATDAASYELTHLLDGPQLAADAMGQSEIDQLLAGFD